MENVCLSNKAAAEVQNIRTDGAVYYSNIKDLCDRMGFVIECLDTEDDNSIYMEYFYLLQTLNYFRRLIELIKKEDDIPA